MILSYDQLFEEWGEYGLSQSNSEFLKRHPHFQTLVAMGKRIVPLVVMDLPHRPHHCFCLLSVLTGASPVPEQDAGHVDKMIQAWADWYGEHEEEFADENTGKDLPIKVREIHRHRRFTTIVNPDN